MKKLIFTLLILIATKFSFATSIFLEGFEYGNHDLQSPVGWVCDDDSWLSGYLAKDHNRIPHSGNWYAFTNATDSWMFMETYFSAGLKYRYYFWAVADGTYDVEFWVGSGPSVSEMTTLLFTKTVNSSEYHRFTEYIETIASDYPYFGIHATAHEGAYYLTIDDMQIDMVGKYDMEVDPMRKDTVMYAGGQAHYHYKVKNTGYEDLEVYMTPYTDFFTDMTFYADGVNVSTFPTVANQVVEADFYATLMPSLEPGTLGWVDIMLTVSCDCVTQMTTLWVTVLGTKTDFPVAQHFDNANYMNAGWVTMGDGPKRWKWSEDNGGILTFQASLTDCTSALYSPKMMLSETANTVRFKVYHNETSGDDRINVYYNTDLTLEGAELLTTIYRNNGETGWVEHELEFANQDNVGFVILEAVGDNGDDIMIDDIVVYNSPLAIEENAEVTNVSIYPNPSSGSITIEGNGIVTVTNVVGQVVLSDEIIENETLTLDKGIYFISLNGTTTKVIIR